MIKISNLFKSYEKKKLWGPSETAHILEEINLQVTPGTIQGLVGPNGAGKTTLIKILCGLQRASGGEIQVCGYDPSKRSKDFYRSIGVVLGHKNSLWWDLPLVDSFRAAKAIYGIEDKVYQKNFSEVTECLKLAEVLNRPVREFSLGERVKSEIACVLLHNPQVLFLDEPTIGLDIESKHDLRNYLFQRAKERQMSVLLTSHDMGDVEQLCDRLALLYNKSIQFNDSLQALMEQSGKAHNIEQTLMAIFKNREKLA
jgi:ABC-2 type transport system ATP-binding protein